MHRIKISYIKVTLLLMIILIFTIIGMFLSEDPISKLTRSAFEFNINAYLENLAQKTTENNLNLIDKTFLYSGLIAGIGISKIEHPEASKLLYHYVFGDGSDLELDSSYFRNSTYLNQIIRAKGLGEHGPLSLDQSEDWRFSLALNPYYLKVYEDKVRVYHPNISFEPVNSENGVVTIVPIGKVRLKVYDKLISALDPTAFYVYSEWAKKSVE